MQSMGFLRKNESTSREKRPVVAWRNLFCFRRFCHIAWRPSVTVTHAYLGKNVRALVLFTFIDHVKKRRNLKVYSLEETKFGNILVTIALQSLKA